MTLPSSNMCPEQNRSTLAQILLKRAQSIAEQAGSYKQVTMGACSGCRGEATADCWYRTSYRLMTVANNIYRRQPSPIDHSEERSSIVKDLHRRKRFYDELDDIESDAKRRKIIWVCVSRSVDMCRS